MRVLLLCLLLSTASADTLLKQSNCCQFANMIMQTYPREEYKMAIVKVGNIKTYHAVLHNDRFVLDNCLLFCRPTGIYVFMEMVKTGQIRVYEWDYNHCQYLNSVPPLTYEQVVTLAE